MTAKDYLQQIRALDVKIKQKQEQYRRLKELASSPGGIRYDILSPQTARSADKLENSVIRYLELEQQIREEMLKLEMARQTAVNQIQSLSDVRYMDVLFKRYVEYKPFKTIAQEMICSVENVFVLHRKALKEFSKFTVNYT